MTIPKLASIVLEKSVVLNVVFYQSTEDLTFLETHSEKPLIICPSPLVADGLRRLMADELEVITISKWVSDYLKAKNKKRSNKAELMLRLSSVWRHYFPTEEAHLFFKSFEVFTDLRSFSLNLELLSEFLKEIDPLVTKSIYLFWTFLDNEKIIDEHKSYQLLSEIELTRPLWIIGFKHLSGIQIDMLKEIGTKNQVTVFFPKDVYDETVNTDWIRWLVPDEKIETESRNKNLKILYFPKNKLNLVLHSYINEFGPFDIALATPHSSFHLKQEVFLVDQFFKSPEDLFSVQREKIIEELTEDLGEQSSEIQIFMAQIEERKKGALKNENYIAYKVLSLLTEALILYGEFQTKVDSFSLKVFKMILELNSPRITMTTLASKAKSRLLELNELPYYESNNRLIIVASSTYGSLKSSESRYSDKMIDSLKAIAPIKRSGLEFSYLKSELIHTLSKTDGLLLMEEGLEIIDLAWREILKDFTPQVIQTKIKYELKGKKDYLLSRMSLGPFAPSQFSASRIQSFLDCPRKYYFTYINKMEHRPEERLKIGQDEMGTIEHLIIEKYFHEIDFTIQEGIERGRHKIICMETFEDFLLKSQLTLSSKDKMSAFYELLHYSQNGIEFLLDFCQKNKACKIQFESSLGENPWSLVGSIDCLVHLQENHVALFDFKRSSSAIGSKKETLAFDKVQIWIYLLIMQKLRGHEIHSWGYVNLSEISSSQIYNETESFSLSDEVLNEFQKILVTAIERLKEETHFKAVPRDEKICDFCEVQLFCDRGSCSS